MNYRDIITIEPEKRGGKPCVRGLRITVYEMLEYLTRTNNTNGRFGKKLEITQMMQLTETGFTEWNDEEEDIYDV